MPFARSVSIVTVINIVSALISILNVAVIAHYFGASESIEIYFAATLLLTIVLSLSSSAQIPDVVLPLYHRTCSMHKSKEGHKAFSVLFNWYIMLAFILLATLLILLPLMINLLVPGFSTDMKSQLHEVALWVLPLMMFQLFVQFSATYINAESHFGWPEATSIPVKFISLGCLFAFADKFDYWALVLGLWLGTIFRFITYVIMLKRLKFDYHFAFSSEYIELQKIAKQLFSSSGFTFATQAFQVALNAGISQLPQGTFAIYSYIIQLTSKTNGIFLRPITLVFFTKVSQLIDTNKAAVQALSKEALNLFAVSAVPAILFTFIYGEPFLKILLGSKDISVEQLDIAVTLLRVFFLLILLTGLANICRRLMFSAGYVEYMYWSSGAVQISAALIALWLLPEYKILGLIAAVSFSPIILTIWLTYITRMKYGVFLFYDLQRSLRWVFVALFVFIVSQLIIKEIVPLHDELVRIDLFFRMLLHVSCYGALIIIFGWIFKINEIRFLSRRAFQLLGLR